jgi:hypothetical protein
MFSGKNPNMNAENEVSMASYNPQHRDDISSCTLSL